MSARRRILFGEPWFDEAEEALVLQTLRGGWIGQGPLVERFEERLGAYVGAQHTVAVNSCTMALHLALLAVGVGPGDEVVTTPFTFVATVNAIEHTGARTVFVDPDRETLNISPAGVAAAITERTKAILPVHFGGRPVDVRGFGELADEHGLWIVEDAAHAVGAVVDGRRVGGGGHARTLTCFSFYPNKNLASAEGGAVCGADRDVLERVRLLRLHGLGADAWARYRDEAYRPSLATVRGFKGNWTDLQAAIALAQLEKLEGFLAIREHLAARYDELLADVDGVEVVDRGRGGLDWRHALHLYQVAVDRRDAVLDRLKRAGIGAAMHYLAVNRHPVYADGVAHQTSDWASDHLLTLPLHPRLSEDDLCTIVGELATAVSAR